MLLSSPFKTPDTLEELLYRAHRLVGYSIIELAEKLKIPPPNTRRSKGGHGQLIEKILGAPSGSLPQKDFPKLGVELKTIPLQASGLPKASTYITRAPVPFPKTCWEDSVLRAKLQRILWIPILPENIITQPFLWEMNKEREKLFQKDWTELTELLWLGHYNELSAHHGTYLQLRPKARNSNDTVTVLSEDLQKRHIVPQGFYLRPSFTRMIFKERILS
jgi:DNA mismatch repair protein MutH